MAKAYNQRHKLLYLLDYLLENTDENHTVSTAQIIEHFKTEYQIPIERKTVYTDINLLQEFCESTETDIEIEYDRVAKGYYVNARDFTLDELQLLINSIQAAKFITQRKAKELTDKLKRQTSRHNRATLDRRVYVPNRIRNMNDRSYYGIDDIHKAIAAHEKISFRYFDYDLNKEKIYNKTSYIVSPYALLWNESNYYLVAYHGGRMKHFRVDKMDRVSIVHEKQEGQDEYKAMKLSERPSKLFSMYGGKEERVTLRFLNRDAGIAIDRFGRDIRLLPEGDGKHFTVSVDVEISPPFFGWLCSFGKRVKLISPAAVVEQMKKYVDGIAGMYQTDE